MNLRKSFWSLLGLMLPFLLGCGPGGPEIATVSGTITLDGKPLPEASVLFINQSGRPAAAWTDQSGNYKLMFDENRSGAIPGDNIVRISTFRFGVEGVPGKKETIAAEYNIRSKLSFKVEPGKKNIANFDLKSGGKIDQGSTLE